MTQDDTALLTGTLAGTGTVAADLVLEQHIAAPRDVVFDFLTEPEKLLRWMGEAAEIQPTVGGRFRLDVNGNDVAEGAYLAVDRPDRVSFTWGWAGSDEVPPGSSIVTFDLRAEGDATVVTLTHSGLPVGQDAKHEEGWSHFFGRLPFVAAREQLRHAELSLMQQRERVAAMRRDLPIGPAVEDYVFESADGPTALTDLFVDDDKPLVLYHFMLGKQNAEPCPSCAMWTDGWNAVAGRLAENLNVAVVTAAPVKRTEEVVAERGWTNLRWVSAVNNTFKLDIGGEDAEGNQSPFLSVYELVDGTPRLTYSGGAHIDGDHWRGVDLLSPVWHFLDLTRPGRGDWMPTL